MWPTALLMQYASFREWYKSQGERTSDAAEAIADAKAPTAGTVTPD
jgi:restriction system protein